MPKDIPLSKEAHLYNQRDTANIQPGRSVQENVIAHAQADMKNIAHDLPPPTFMERIASGIGAVVSEAIMPAIYKLIPQGAQEVANAFFQGTSNAYSPYGPTLTPVERPDEEQHITPQQEASYEPAAPDRSMNPDNPGKPPGFFNRLGINLLSTMIFHFIMGNITLAWIPFALAAILGIWGWGAKPPEEAKKKLDEIKHGIDVELDKRLPNDDEGKPELRRRLQIPNPVGVVTKPIEKGVDKARDIVKVDVIDPLAQAFADRKAKQEERDRFDKKQLLEQAPEYGIKADDTWPLDELRKAVRKAEREKQEREWRREAELYQTWWREVTPYNASCPRRHGGTIPEKHKATYRCVQCGPRIEYDAAMLLLNGPPPPPAQKPTTYYKWLEERTKKGKP